MWVLVLIVGIAGYIGQGLLPSTSTVNECLALSPHRVCDGEHAGVQRGGHTVEPPTEPPAPPGSGPVPEPNPPEKSKHPNAGRGNGPEGDPDEDPGNSGGHNHGGD